MPEREGQEQREPWELAYEAQWGQVFDNRPDVPTEDREILLRIILARKRELQEKRRRDGRDE